MAPRKLDQEGEDTVFSRPLATRGELAELTSAFEARCEQGAAIPELVSSLDEIHESGHFSFMIAGYPANYLPFWRARYMSEKPWHVSQLTYPQPSLVKKEGRLNGKGESIFYSSFGYATCLLECGAQASERFVISKWKNNRLVKLNHLGFSRQLIDRLNSMRTFPNFLHPDPASEANIFLADWQSKLFTQIVPEGSEARYRSTIALSKWALAVPDFDGLMYPSIADVLLSDNVGFRPEVADEGLDFAGAEYIRIEKKFIHDEGQRGELFTARTIDSCRTLRADGSLDWLSSPTGETLFA